MKKTTELHLDKAEQLLSRAFIDRKRKVQSAILAEKRNIIKECGGNITPAYLYDYYVSICQIPTWDLTDDKKVSHQLGLTQRKVADARRLLTKLGWIRFDVHLHGKVKYGLWFIGKDVVSHKMKMDTPIEEFLELGLVLDGDLQDEK